MTTRPLRVVAALAALSGSAWAGPTGAADPHAAPATGFPGSYLRTVSLSLEGDPFFGSRFLDALQLHLRSVCAMTAPRAVGAYLEQAAAAGEGVGDLRDKLGLEAMSAPQVSALLIADALARPSQAREVLDRLESLRAGLGRHSAEILKGARGTGDKSLIAALRAAGDYSPRGEFLTYGPDGRFDALFDGASAGGPSVSDEPVEPPASDQVPRRSGLRLPERR